MQLGANWYWKISKSIKTRDTKDLARQNTNYLMSSASACPFDSLHRRPRGVQRVGRWANEVTSGGAESAYKNSIPLSIEVNKTRQLSVDGHLYNAARISVIYLIKVRLSPPAYPPLSPPRGPCLTEPPPSAPVLRYPLRHKACASEVSMRQSPGMTMLIPRMNASDAS